MPELVAVDTARGWMLMRDGGEQLRASIRPTKDLSRGNRSSQSTPNYRSDSLNMSMRFWHWEFPIIVSPPFPQLYTELLADEASLMIDQEKGLTSDDFQQLHNLKPRFEQICADLAAYRIPESVNHGDFHDGNILLKNGRITFFDWGDADVTHPFVSLRTFFVSIEIALDLDDYLLYP